MIWIDVAKLVGASSWLALATQVVRYYSKPHLSYRAFRLGNLSVVRFWIKSFEPVDVDEELHFEVSATGGLDEVSVAAGPWCSVSPAVLRSNDASELGRVRVVLNGCPADGSVQIDATPTVASDDVRIDVVAQSPTQVRGFGPVAAWGTFEFVRSDMIRALVGVSGSMGLFWLTVESVTSRRGLGFEWRPGDSVILVVLAAVCLLAYGLAVPAKGKAITCGYQGDVAPKIYRRLTTPASTSR
jgi:hypothetical protein